MTDPRYIRADEERLKEVALEYARACDAGEYPKLHMLAKSLKSAARRLAWTTDDRWEELPERTVKLHRDR